MSYDYSDLKLKLNIENILNKNTSRIHMTPDTLSLKSKVKKNVLTIGIAWIFLFTAFQSMANLQSSLNNDQGLGTASLSAIYITLVISSMFLPPLLIEKFGTKWTIVICQFSYLLYIASNIVPRWTTLIPSACILGTFAGGLWSAKCTYLTELAYMFSELTGESSEVVVNRFFGYFFAMFQTSQILGNLISSLVLKSPTPPASIYTNLTNIMRLDKCGANDCPTITGDIQTVGQIITRPTDSTVYLLCFIYLMLALTSICLIAFLLDSFEIGNKKPPSSSLLKLDLLMSTINHMRDPNQMLLIPITLWLGFSLAFIGADYTKSFVACSKGVDKVGFAMICFGLTDALGSYAFGELHKLLGRKACFCIGAAINYITLFIMLFWKVNLEQDYLFYLIPALWGVADAAWQTQVNSLYGVLFKDNHNAAFSNFRLWESLGFAISYAYSSYFCMSKKIYLLVVFLSMGMIGYFLVELNESRSLGKNNQFVRNFNKAQVILFGVLIFYEVFFILI